MKLCSILIYITSINFTLSLTIKLHKWTVLLCSKQLIVFNEALLYNMSASNISISPCCCWMPESSPVLGMYCIHTVENMSLPTSQSVVYTPIPFYHKWSAFLCSHWQSLKMSHPVRRGKYLLMLVLQSSV